MLKDVGMTKQLEKQLAIAIRTIYMAKTFGKTLIDVYFELFLSISHPGPHGVVFLFFFLG